jgi:hypothetical protein
VTSRVSVGTEKERLHQLGAARLDELLEVVQDHERGLLGERLDGLLQRLALGECGHAQGVEEGTGDQVLGR